MPEKNRNSHRQSRPHRGQRVLVRFLVFSLVWLVLTGSDWSSWLVGLPAVLFAVACSMILAPSSFCSLSLTGAVRFISFFLRQSSHSGIDVMLRTLSSPLRVNPGLVTYDTFLPSGSPRVFFVNTISLLPGTLSADLAGDTVTIHTIDKDLPIWGNIQGLEWRVAAIFGVHPTGKEEE
jgi:multicomponent Na+:H+ antiporter subunit E